MIELLTADTPNGKKISIMLEEIKFEYKVTKINILKVQNYIRKRNIKILVDVKIDRKLYVRYFCYVKQHF